ncbi:uncharacterized protein TNCV_1099801 [Trichonephila clavipes]|nr:uncharacterized protein TNCV_1099801 [Trichonephila clavipes]
MWNPQKAGYLLRNILGSKVVKTNLKEDFHINYSVTSSAMFVEGLHTPTVSDSPTGKSPVETDQAKVTLLCFTQSFDTVMFYAKSIMGFEQVCRVQSCENHVYTISVQYGENYDDIGKRNGLSLRTVTAISFKLVRCPIHVPNDPRYARLETNRRIGQAKEVQFPRAWHHSKRRRQWVDFKGSTHNGRHDPKCPSARRLRIVREDTGAPSEGATCAWMAVYEAVGCTRAFLTM